MQLTSDSSPPPGSTKLNVDGRYDILNRVDAVSGPRIFVGSSGVCRYCGETRAALFRKKAHTFPEFLGNRRVFSRDECDACNQLFSAYETELAAYLRPFF